ncbi:MAG TPA: helix-turn-helix domain-containing protein [Hyphomicrobiaceae bacterium]|nr:helix-turn-helix domain-containing protein [Hyphomicrobiaceae bacterium]
MAGRDDRPDSARGSADAPGTPLPATLARTLAWLREHLSEKADLAQLASIAGVRPRTLETHFRVYLRTTPTEWVRRMRLAQARRELQRARDDASVTAIALESGFNQLGRFAAQYRALFGETPSATLRHSRRSAAVRNFDVDDEALRLTWQAMPNAFAIAPGECSKALETLARASELAPGYGLPVALAAWCWAQRAAHGFSATPRQDAEQALRLAVQAQKLAANDALALTLASGALTLRHQLDEADRLLERALAIDPWQPYAWVRRGWASAYGGDPHAAQRELHIALHLSPLGPMRDIASIGMGCAHFACERYEAAARWVQSGTKAFPGGFWADRVTAAAAVHAGARDEARRIARRLMRKDPHLTADRARTAWPFPAAFMARLGDGLEIAGVPRS